MLRGQHQTQTSHPKHRGPLPLDANQLCARKMRVFGVPIGPPLSAFRRRLAPAYRPYRCFGDDWLPPIGRTAVSETIGSRLSAVPLAQDRTVYFVEAGASIATYAHAGGVDYRKEHVVAAGVVSGVPAAQEALAMPPAICADPLRLSIA